MATTSELKVATIGAGYFSAFHVAGWAENPDVTLNALADLDRAKAEDLLARTLGEGHGVATFGDAEEMLAAVRPDIVDIASPPESHAALIELALRFEPRAIICQKPFCGGLDAARRTTGLARDRGVLLVVHENFRFQPWYRLIRERIAAGAIGRCRVFSCTKPPSTGSIPSATCSASRTACGPISGGSIRTSPARTAG